MGNVSSLLNCVKKRYVVYKMRALLCEAVNDAIRDTDGTLCCSRFVKQTECVRRMTSGWRTMVQMTADKYADVKSTLLDIVNVFPDNDFHTGHVFCFCTFSIDLCVLMLTRKQHVDVDDVMYCLTESLVCKNIDSCTDFLKSVYLKTRILGK